MTWAQVSSIWRSISFNFTIQTHGVWPSNDIKVCKLAGTGSVISVVNYLPGEGFKHQQNQDLVSMDALGGPPENPASRCGSEFISVAPGADSSA